ncbi:MAG: head completion/stabilization protein [Methylococcales bacterium]
MSLTGKPQLTTNAPLTNDGFWPALVVGDFVSKYRIPPEYDDGVISWGLSLGMIRVNKHLASAKEQCLNPQLLDTTKPLQPIYLTLDAFAATRSEQVEGEEVIVRQYKHACYCMAKAYLLQQFNTMNRRPQAENLKKESPDAEDYWLNQAQWAINWILKEIVPGMATTSDFGVYVELI